MLDEMSRGTKDRHRVNGSRGFLLVLKVVKFWIIYRLRRKGC